MSITLDPSTTGSEVSFSNGNLTFGISSTNNANAIATMPAFGKYYFEVTLAHVPASAQIGVSQLNRAFGLGIMGDSDADDGEKGSSIETENYRNWYYYPNSADWSSWAEGDVVGMAVDTDAGHCWYCNNGEWWNASTKAFVTTFPGGTTNIVSVYPSATYPLYAAVGKAATSGSSEYRGTINFGDSSFTATLPTGYKSYVDARQPSRTSNVFHRVNKVVNPFPLQGGV